MRRFFFFFFLELIETPMGISLGIYLSSLIFFCFILGFWRSWVSHSLPQSMEDMVQDPFSVELLQDKN